MSLHYDAVIIGSGQGGTPLSMAFAKAQKKTALIESTHVGGCCVNEGCTPTKTMIASGRVAYLTRRGPEYGVTSSKPEEVRINMEKVRQRKRDIVDSFRSGSERRLRDAGVNVISGSASFENENTINVASNNGDDKTITADKIFICTGERPAPPNIEGFNAKSFPAGTVLDSTSIQELGVVPSHLIVVGGGYVGLEFGQLFRRLGADVTIIQRNSQLLPREDKEVADEMLKILKQDGISVLLKTSLTEVRATGSTDSAKSISATASGPEGTPRFTGSHILFAAGRVPNTKTLNLDAAGIKTSSRGHIVVDETLQTSNPRVWALGDVKGPPAFTHVSYDDFRLLQGNLLEKDSHPTAMTTVDRILPYVVYTDPQLAHVGLHEKEAREKYPNAKIQVARMPMAYVARALETDESRGLMKAIIDADSQKILGFTCLGLEGGEIMSVVQMAMIAGSKWTALRGAVWAHPSLAESLNNIWGMLE
ncbi:unnamed protein product [Clonostachys chloroleuca]|uniref:Mercuric reductase n=1 Tax=Clonostachys chloroleuca TaxID=1926264 RepID=A0AA35Q5H5_9HYPO|nr:unnamed protein product [Clonostachys chloroleuca]